VSVIKILKKNFFLIYIAVNTARIPVMKFKKNHVILNVLLVVGILTEKYRTLLNIDAYSKMQTYS